MVCELVPNDLFDLSKEAGSHYFSMHSICRTIDFV
jgi:hypothetical protein